MICASIFYEWLFQFIYLDFIFICIIQHLLGENPHLHCEGDLLQDEEVLLEESQILLLHLAVAQILLFAADLTPLLEEVSHHRLEDDLHLLPEVVPRHHLRQGDLDHPQGWVILSSVILTGYFLLYFSLDAVLIL